MNSDTTRIVEKTAIHVENVLHQYRNGDDNGMFIAEWRVDRGQQIFLHGESGSGKTTLLNLLAGVLTPDKGEIQILGKPFSTLKAHTRDKFRADHIGVVFQQFNLIPYLSVLKNIQLANHFSSTHLNNVEDLATDYLQKLNLPPNILFQPANAISIGQQQRVAIARALINQPELLLVDEPTSALDVAAKDAFMAILTEICQEAGTTLVFVSHDMHLKQFFPTSVEITELVSTKENQLC
ncbi:ABC transporter ATP-binding protein [Alteromonas sp. ASW11-130]|uniref:ABC transporter ATP-binding protein n=1 Tax=Alteromonas sp. ASW11-130 TaxID=3015775 RepID=UPI0022427082|nr:ABC transporter ATP-binding protein [Alteromonas sp. ASW11-130]MCW8091213.1 ABC transporter ATP-binding protein [Alteromonas sp. ASW11-130]